MAARWYVCGGLSPHILRASRHLHAGWLLACATVSGCCCCSRGSDPVSRGRQLVVQRARVCRSMRVSGSNTGVTTGVGYPSVTVRSFCHAHAGCSSPVNRDRVHLSLPIRHDTGPMSDLFPCRFAPRCMITARQCVQSCSRAYVGSGERQVDPCACKSCKASASTPDQHTPLRCLKKLTCPY